MTTTVSTPNRDDLVPPTTASSWVPTPIGPVRLCAAGGVLVHLHLPNDVAPRRGPDSAAADPGDRAVLATARRQLDEYFDRRRRRFDLPLGPVGTDFQLEVWDALSAIPYGETISYGELARRVGRPRASRAVGQANGANPLAIVVPCHRVVASGGGIGGYGGGLPAKRTLLALEGVVGPA